MNLLGMGTVWTAVDHKAEVFEGRECMTGAAQWTATRTDLIFGSNFGLGAVARVYARTDAKLVKDLVAARGKVVGRF